MKTEEGLAQSGEKGMRGGRRKGRRKGGRGGEGVEVQRERGGKGRAKQGEGERGGQEFRKACDGASGTSAACLLSPSSSEGGTEVAGGEVIERVTGVGGVEARGGGVLFLLGLR